MGKLHSQGLPFCKKNDKCEVLENVSIDKEKPTKYIPHCSLTPLFFSRQASGRVNQICDHLHLLGRDSFHVAHWNHLKEPQGVCPGASAEDRPLAAPVHFKNTKKYVSPNNAYRDSESSKKLDRSIYPLLKSTFRGV
jgi:hypothetical protein